MPRNSGAQKQGELFLFDLSDFDSRKPASAKPARRPAPPAPEPAPEPTPENPVLLPPVLEAPPPEEAAGQERAAQYDRNRAIMQGLIEIGGSGLIAPLLQAFEDIKLEQLRYFCAPIVVQKSQWASHIKGDSMAWLRTAIYKDRLEIIFEELKTGQSDRMAAPSELIACLYPATMDSPIRREWADIYLYAGSTAIPKHKWHGRLPKKADGTPFKDWWEFMGMDGHPVTWSQIKEDYSYLARDIRRVAVAQSFGHFKAADLRKVRLKERSCRD